MRKDKMSWVGGNVRMEKLDGIKGREKSRAISVKTHIIPNDRFDFSTNTSLTDPFP